MPISRRQLVILLVLFAALAVGIVLHERQPWPEPGEAAQLSFHPDAVVALKWTDHGHEFALTRKSRDEAWTPAADPAIVQAKLNALASTKLSKTSIPSRPDVTIEIGFGPGNVWTANYYDGTFAWASGAHKGEGFLASEKLDAFFREGEFAFRNRKWNWCTDRPMRLEFQVAGHVFTAHDTHRGWEGERDGQKVAFDSGALEKWFGRNCEIPVEHYRDLRAYPLGLSSGPVRFVAHLLTGARFELRDKNGVWSIGAQPLGFRSRQWDEEIAKLATFAR